MRFTSIIAACIATVLIAAGCSGNDNVLSSSSSGMTGDLGGWVVLKNGSNDNIGDNSGVTVSVEGTSFSATTDASGKWSIDELPAGTYTITFSKAGYGVYKEIGYQFVGGGDAYIPEVRLNTNPDGMVSSIALRSVDTMLIVKQYDDTIFGGPVTYDTVNQRYVSIYPTIEWEANPRDSTIRILYFIGTGSDVSDAPGKHLFRSFFSANIYEPGRKVTSLTIPEETFLQYGITSGTTIYIVAYAVNYHSTQYYDPTMNEIVYSSRSGPSSVASVVVP